MKAWALEHRGASLAGFYWTGDGLKFTNSVDDAVLFVREIDAKRVLTDNLLLDAKPVEVAVGSQQGEGQCNQCSSGKPSAS